MKRIPFLGLLLVLLFAGCSREATSTPEATLTPEPPPFKVTYCDINPSDMCLEGFGLEDEDKMLILFQANDRFFADIYIRADLDQEEIVFECQQSQNFPENVYCLGDAFDEGDNIKLNIHAKNNDRLIAEGVFIVQYGNLPEPDVEFGAATPTTTAPAPTTVPSSTPESSYPNPSYPNPSYPNPNITP
ncbi:MAG: hypothetical protein PVJ21_08880 [Anaerolineales bacterium]|jgi:hypothetical protein